MKYSELKQKHQSEVDAFPIGFAFSKDQMGPSLERLGLKPTDTDKVISIGGGGFIKKADKNAYNDLLERIHKETQDAIAADKTGDGFIYDMFNYELANHEYCVSGELDDTLYALDLKLEDIEKDPRMMKGLKKAIKNQSEVW